MRNELKIQLGEILTGPSLASTNFVNDLATVNSIKSLVYYISNITDKEVT